MKIESQIGIHNRFDIEVRNALTGELTQEATAFNIVLNQMWTQLVNFLSYHNNIHFGTGTGTLAPARTALFTWLGQKASTNETIIRAIPVSVWTKRIVINPEEFVGQTIREVAIGHSTAASSLVTHALLRDAEGNPISITKTNLDIVTIYATVFVTFSTQNANVKIIGMPNANLLVNYLVGGGTFPTCQFYAGEAPIDRSELQQFITAAPEGPLGTTGNIAVANWIRDAANRKASTPPSPAGRFASTVGNGHVVELGFGSANSSPVYSSLLPIAGVHAGQPCTGITLGVGNGEQTKFQLPSRNVRQNSIIVKIEGGPTDHFSKNLLAHLQGIQPPATLPGSSMRTLAWSPDGQYLAAGSDTSDSTRFRWYKRTGDTLAELTQPATLPGSNMQTLAWSPDGQYLAAGSDTGDATRFRLYKNLNNITEIDFNTPPTGTITSDYIVDGIHKTDQYVVDVAFSLQYGEVTP